ncbi:hypothetical protein BCV70DRAFT_67029 [Testicularia cyperi]|uniref:LamG-like jellyroll fold domain-containing protein n=1 Tax=Testicularia cyperi TaxID=1882483 RepID=A0A317XJE4_9BASI|nr:hypothetical protein BCV70DRAFT_67029 [Testicularia cyperi]
MGDFTSTGAGFGFLDNDDPNSTFFAAPVEGKYTCSRLVTHNGQTIAFALRIDKDGSRPIFDYAYLDASNTQASDAATSAKPSSKSPEQQKLRQIDSQCWSETALPLSFANELRVVGQEAVPVYKIPSIDKTGHFTTSTDSEKLDSWLSTTACLTETSVTSFQVLSDGKYIYLFRLALDITSPSCKLPNTHKDPKLGGVPPVTGNILCDRFVLNGQTLQRPLEVRYRRSGQKRLPLNDRDTLAVRDINGAFFHEPTFLLEFARPDHGRFFVLRTPTIVNDVYRWLFFCVSQKDEQIDCFTTDAASDGLFDLHGHLYYTCDSTDHDAVFSTSAGSCIALTKPDGKECSKPKRPLVPSSALSDRSIALGGEKAKAYLSLPNTIKLSKGKFSNGFTLEAWIKPSADRQTGEISTIFGFDPVTSPLSVVIDQNHKIAFMLHDAAHTIARSSQEAVRLGDWNHVAITYHAGAERAYSLIVNGTEEHSAPFYLNPDQSPGDLSYLGNNDEIEGLSNLFTGSMDEVRLWHRALPAATVEAFKTTRAVGLEDLLSACWHFDEGSGEEAYDATSNGHKLYIIAEDNVDYTTLWEVSHAPLVNNVGLSRRTLRLPPAVQLTGGLSASTYFEQVSVTKEGQDSNEANKPLKRGARVFLCAVAQKAGNKSALLTLDFGLLADGTLCDTPGIIPIEVLPFSDNATSNTTTISTSLLYVDSAGMEVFGGLIDTDQTRSSNDAPYVWESATGGLTIFFRHENGMFCALPYDISRTIPASRPLELGNHKGLTATGKLRNATKISLRTSSSKLLPPSVAVDVIIEAEISGGSKIVEEWKALPATTKEFCNHLNGIQLPTTKSYLGVLKAVEALPQLANGAGAALAKGGVLLRLDTRISTALPPASCLQISEARVHLLRGASPGDDILLVSASYNGDHVLDLGSAINFLGYDAEILASCKGKPSGDFARGSSLVALSASPSSNSELSIFAELQADSPFVNVEASTWLLGRGKPPFFTTPPRSRSLVLGTDACYSMLGTPSSTAPCSGITFETWLRPTALLPTPSVVVAYTSQHLPRSENGKNEQQTFVLSIETTTNQCYTLKANVNGRLLRLPADHPVVRDSLKENRWSHFACSYQNAYALAFNGHNYVDFGSATELNASDFSILFSLRYESSQKDQIVLSKAEKEGDVTPYEIRITPAGQIKWIMHAEPEGGKVQQLEFTTRSSLLPNQPYKIFMSRKGIMVSVKDKTPRRGLQFTVKVWDTAGRIVCDMTPSTVGDLEKNEATNLEGSKLGGTETSTRAWTNIESSEAPLVLGGAPWAPGSGLRGSVGAIKIFSNAIAAPQDLTSACSPNASERSMLGSWSFNNAQGRVLLDDTGRNDGKLKLDPTWILSPFTPDAKLLTMVNGKVVPSQRAEAVSALAEPAGPHQLTLGNSMHGHDDFRVLLCYQNFTGELDELRIWNVARTLESICDNLYSRLSEVSDDMAIYLPFDDTQNETASQKGLEALLDSSNNCWHLSPLHGGKCQTNVSGAPIGIDAPCVRHSSGMTAAGSAAVGNGATLSPAQGGSITLSGPSVVEYGDVQISHTGELEGSYKRAYTFIDSQNRWKLVTGFKIGALTTEWVSQVQTAPTLIGYIEGAPPVPAENYTDPEEKPKSSVSFKHAQSCKYTYSASREAASDFELNTSRGIGAEWEVSAGLGVETNISEGSVVGTFSTALNTSNGQVNNAVSASTTNANLEMKVEITGSFTKTSDEKDAKADYYVPANMGLALVESEVADVFALRLKMRGPVMPLVAYQMRPNPDIPKDRNLVAFQINPTYTKQGCLDGRRGLSNDPDYQIQSSGPPKDASYYKPVEAYALKDRIRRQEEQLAGEWERFTVDMKDRRSLRDFPNLSKRNICNSYVWTADGGTFQETHSSMDMVQTEVGGTTSMSTSIGAALEAEISVGSMLNSFGIDALWSSHLTLSMSKDKESETSFELEAEMPDSIDLREPNALKQMDKRPGAVDAYRWMSFWLEPSTESTDVFFQKVVDPKWLESPTEQNAATLRELKTSLDQEKGNARTKAWRVLHRCTYVSRVPERVLTSPAAALATAPTTETKSSSIDLNSSWMIIQQLEPYIRACQTKVQIAQAMGEPDVVHLYPTLRANAKYWAQVIELLADYIGVLL